MGYLLSVFGETPFLELVCVLTATKKLLTNSHVCSPGLQDSCGQIQYTHVGSNQCFSFMKVMRSSSDIIWYRSPSSALWVSQ